jgi:Fe-Mn family superoxide dismutase
VITRREMLRAAGATAVLTAAPRLFTTARAAQDKPNGFTLPKLPYEYDALEPHIDAETMRIHHTQHHQTYVNNLNKALSGMPDWLTRPIEEVVRKLGELPENIRTAVRNNGGGHWNHTFFWEVMKKDGGEPQGELRKAIDDSFGGLDGFKKEFLAAATGRFGSGWAWLVPGQGKPLAITSTPNQDNTMMDNNGPKPILGIDVWEHAYYLKYRSARAKYVEAWFNVINWDRVAENFARKG